MHWLYLRSVLRHKWFVYLAGRKLGLGRWQMLVHDWQKFLPVEWVPYARTFYGGRYPTQEWCDTIGVPFTGRSPLTKERVKASFRLAWLHHQKFGPHHWQYWVLLQDDGDHKALPMPRRYLLEMCADWRGANKAYGDQPLLAWYTNTAKGRLLHPDTRAEVERILFDGPILFAWEREGRGMPPAFVRAGLQVPDAPKPYVSAPREVDAYLHTPNPANKPRGMA